MAANKAEWDREAYLAACAEPDQPPFDDCAELKVVGGDGREWAMIRLVDLQTAIAFHQRKSPED